jgi:hypothetical protein
VYPHQSISNEDYIGNITSSKVGTKSSMPLIYFLKNQKKREKNLENDFLKCHGKLKKKSSFS